MTRQIELVVALGGAVRLETRGFASSQCREASQFLEAALGTSTSERLTAEFYQTAGVALPLEQAKSAP